MLTPSTYFSDTFNNRIIPVFLKTIGNKGTAREYYSYIRLLCNYLEKDFLDIDESDARSYFSYLCGRTIADGFSRKTINVRFACYRTIGRFIEEQRLIEGYKNPFLEIERAPVDDNVSIVRVISMSDLDKIMTAASSNPMMYLILALSGRAGLTLSSILRIRINNIEISNERVYLCFPPQNDFEDETIVQLPQDVGILMQNYLQTFTAYGNTGHIFYNQHHRPLTARNVDAAIDRIVKASGVPHHYTLKDIRTRCIIDLINSGIDPTNIAKYVGLSIDRVKMYTNAASVANSCPADLVSYQLKSVI